MRARAVHIMAFLIFIYSGLVAHGFSVREQAQWYVDKGLALNDNSDVEAGYYRRAIDVDPGYAAAYFNLGYVYQSNGELERAIDSYRRCVELDDRRADAHRNLARCLLVVRRDAALYDVRHHLNLAVEIQEETQGNNRSAPLEEMRRQLLDVERRIHAVLNPTIGDFYSREEIIKILSRPVTRGGMGVYAGPRLELLVYEANEVKLTDTNASQLRALAQAMSSPILSQFNFTIEGHTDGRGATGRNLEISRRRTAAVLEWLVSHGDVAPARLTSEYYGEDHPIFPNDSDQNYRYNRRIEIVRRFMP